MDLIGAKHPFYEVAWRRYATVGMAASWALFEWFLAFSPFWGVLATGVTALAAYEPTSKYKQQPKDTGNDAKP